MKMKRITRIALGVLVGIVLLAGVIWVLTATLGNSPQSLFAGKPIGYWQEQLNGGASGASNEAWAVVNRRVIPDLTRIMVQDTNDSTVRLQLIETLNGLPGVQIYFTPAGGRRAYAAQILGALGPAAKSAIPTLLETLKGKDSIVHGAAIQALGSIHSDPQVVVPLLIEYLADDNLNDEAALALANYGSLARAAVPKIVPLLHAPDKDARAAAETALKKIDPEAYANATKADQNNATNSSSRSPQPPPLKQK